MSNYKEEVLSLLRKYAKGLLFEKYYNKSEEQINNENIKKYIDTYVDVKIMNVKVESEINDYLFSNCNMPKDFVEYNLKSKMKKYIDNIDFSKFEEGLSDYNQYENNDYYDVDWVDVLKELKDKITINLNYGAPSTTYVPMATYRVVSLIDKRTYMRGITPPASINDVIVELEKCDLDNKGKIVPDHKYKLYIPLSKFLDPEIQEIAKKNDSEFERKTSVQASRLAIMTATSGLQGILKVDKQYAMDGVRLHREKSVEFSRMDAMLAYVASDSENNDVLSAEDISAPETTSIAIYGEPIKIKKKIFEKEKGPTEKDADAVTYRYNLHEQYQESETYKPPKGYEPPKIYY